MCRGNDESRACGSSINHLLASQNSRIIFGPACNRAMWQHIIRHKLKPTRAAAAAVGWDGPDGLYQRMFLRRPDGQPWSDAWERLVIPRVQEALQRRAKDAIALRLVAEVPGAEPVWADWAQGFLSSEWDGFSKDEKSGKELLAIAARAQCREQPDAPAKETEHEGQDSEMESGAHQQHEDEGEADDELARDVRRWLQDAEIPSQPGSHRRNGRRGWLQAPSLSPIPELDIAQPGAHTATGTRWPRPSSISPRDSISQINSGLPYMTRTRPPSPPLPQATQGANANSNTSEASDQGDDEMACWAASLSSEAIAGLIHSGVENMVSFHVEMTKVQMEAAVRRDDAGVRARQDELRQGRELLLEQLCFLEDLLDSRLREKYGLDGGPPISWPFSGIVWSHAYYDPEHTSPMLEIRADQRKKQMLG